MSSSQPGRQRPIKPLSRTDTGAEAKEAKPVLEKIKQDPDPAVVKLAADALGKM